MVPAAVLDDECGAVAAQAGTVRPTAGIETPMEVPRFSVAAAVVRHDLSISTGRGTNHAHPDGLTVQFCRMHATCVVIRTKGARFGRMEVAARGRLFCGGLRLEAASS